MHRMLSQINDHKMMRSDPAYTALVLIQEYVLLTMHELRNHMLCLPSRGILTSSSCIAAAAI